MSGSARDRPSASPAKRLASRTFGQASSHGCIIVGDAALTTVFRTVGAGTPVIVTR